MISVRTLRAAGLTNEQIVRVIEADENERIAARREQNRINQQNHRSRQQVSTDHADLADHADTPSPLSPSPSSPLIPPNNPLPLSPLPLSSTVADATRREVGKDFDEFWKVYPKREGANPKEPARKAFLAALKAGSEAPAIVSGARACAARDRDKIGTPYIPQAVKWLRDRRWEDYAATGPPGSDQPAWMKPPPGAVSYLDKMRTNGNGATLGTEIRNDTGLGKSGADNTAELPLPSGGALRAS